MNIVEILRETRGESGRGSAAGREKAKEAPRIHHTKAQKSRVKVYNTIMDALKHGYFGQIFSTKNADRLYVISKRKWGHDPEQAVGNKTAKGFTPGSATPAASWPSIKKFAVRTMLRHGKQKEKKFMGPKFWKDGYRGKK